MHIGKIDRGDRLVCCQCSHERIVEEAWVNSVCDKFFPNRHPPNIFESDLARFRCSSCKSKKLLKRGKQSLVPIQRKATEVTTSYQFASSYLDQATIEEKKVLLNWAQQLIAIRDTDLSPRDKAEKAILLTLKSGAINPFITFLAGEIKRLGWDERGLPERLALSAAAAAALVFGGQGAGIAALGGAIGVPLWIVFGAGGAFAGVIIDEAKRRIDKEDRTDKRASLKKLPPSS